MPILYMSYLYYIIYALFFKCHIDYVLCFYLFILDAMYVMNDLVSFDCVEAGDFVLVKVVCDAREVIDISIHPFYAQVRKGLFFLTQSFLNSQD